MLRCVVFLFLVGLPAVLSAQVNGISSRFSHAEAVTEHTPGYNAAVEE